MDEGIRALARFGDRARPLEELGRYAVERGSLAAPIRASIPTAG